MFGVLADRIIAAFNAVTERHDAAIHAAAGLPWPPSDGMRAAIKHWDLVMFVTEWRDLMKGREHPDWSPYVGVESLEFPITPWQWRLAAERFRSKCETLLPCFQRDSA